jgi:hypothetical protein
VLTVPSGSHAHLTGAMDLGTLTDHHLLVAFCTLDSAFLAHESHDHTKAFLNSLALSRGCSCEPYAFNRRISLRKAKPGVMRTRKLGSNQMVEFKSRNVAQLQ